MSTEGAQWERDTMKGKYMFMYAKDVEVAPRPDNTAVEHFRTRLGFFWFLLRNKAARDAIRAERFQFITITATRKSSDTPSPSLPVARLTKDKDKTP